MLRSSSGRQIRIWNTNKQTNKHQYILDGYWIVVVSMPLTPVHHYVTLTNYKSTSDTAITSPFVYHVTSLPLSVIINTRGCTSGAKISFDNFLWYRKWSVIPIDINSPIHLFLRPSIYKTRKIFPLLVYKTVPSSFDHPSICYIALLFIRFLV
jgi:hypothetical protein